MKRSTLVILSIVLLIALGAGVYFYLGSQTPSSPAFSCEASVSKPTIAAFGDSLVAGYGAPDQQGFVGPLSTQLGVTIIDDGVSGDTTAQALARVQTVIAQHPDIVVLLIGGNDALQQVPIATTKENIGKIISMLQSSGIRVVLAGVLGGIVSDPFKPMYADLAKTYSLAYIPNVLDGLIGNSKYMYDEVHPNAAGYDIIATKLYPVVNGACQQYAKKDAAR